MRISYQHHKLLCSCKILYYTTLFDSKAKSISSAKKNLLNTVLKELVSNRIAIYLDNINLLILIAKKICMISSRNCANFLNCIYNVQLSCLCRSDMSLHKSSMPPRFSRARRWRRWPKGLNLSQ